MNLDDLRKEIDKCNKNIIKSLKERFIITRKIGKFKAQNNLEATDKERENKMLDNIKNIAKEANLNQDMVEDIFKIIIKEVVKEHIEIKNGNKNYK